MKLIVLFCLIAFPLSFSDIYADSYTKSLEEGIELSYNMKLDEAGKIFDRLIKNNAANPRAYHYKSSIYFWKLMSTTDDSDFELFIKYSDQTIKIADEWLTANSADKDIKLLIGNNYTFRTIALARRENYLECIWSAQKANSFLENIYKSDSLNYDSYLGLGLFKIFLSQVPSSFKWALEVIGFEADLNKGIEYLSLAAHHAKKMEVESKFYYAFILSELLHEYKQSEIILTKLSDTYPSNILFTYFIAINQIKMKDLHEAERILRTLQKTKNGHLPKLISFTHFLLGDISYYKGDYKKAILHYTDFLNKTKEKDYRGIAALRLAYSYELEGNRNSAEGVYQLAGGGNLSIDEDRYAERKGKEYLKKVMSHSEALLIQVESMAMRGKIDTALGTLSFIKMESDDREVLAYADYLKAKLLLEKGDIEGAQIAATEVLKYPSLDEKWIYPFSYAILAETALLLGKFGEYEEFKIKAGDYSDYDFNSKLKGQLFVLDYRMVKNSK